ncbi:Nckx30C [Symbiodinium sp. CCMP2456]|nr:Nckx30C [Symbiodinium sp. CCMP2456]
MLLGLNTVCDVYFTGALEIMVEKWHIKPDVAGATFMAAGGSAPELFTSLVGATIANNDVGFGTIIGSAVFNVLFVIGLCGYVAKEPIQLTWWPLFRDCSYYILGLSLLAGFASDERISLVEAILLFVAYIVYCIIMYFNSSLEALVHKYSSRAGGRSQESASEADPSRPPVIVGNWAGTTSGQVSVVPNATTPPSPSKTDPQPPSHGDVAVPELGTDGPRQVSKSSEEDSSRILCSQPLPSREPWVTSQGIERFHKDPARKEEEGTDIVVSSQPLPMRSQKLRLSARTARAAALQEAARDRHEERRHSESDEAGQATRSRQCSKQSAGMQQVQETPEESKPTDEQQEEEEEEEEPGFMDFPNNAKDQVIWLISLPVLLPIYFLTPLPSERLFLLTFLFSLVWIALLSFCLVWWVEILGEALHIDPILMSFTLLAAGTSIPDAASSVAVAKQGEGDMAVSSSVGSNIFDILVGLPIPWMIKIALNDASYQVTIKSPFLAFDVILRPATDLPALAGKTGHKKLLLRSGRQQDAGASVVKQNSEQETFCERTFILYGLNLLLSCTFTIQKATQLALRVLRLAPSVLGCSSSACAPVARWPIFSRLRLLHTCSLRTTYFHETLPRKLLFQVL